MTDDFPPRRGLGTMNEVAAFLGVSRKFVQRHLKAGDFGGKVLLGRSVRIPWSAVAAFIRRRTVDSSTPARQVAVARRLSPVLDGDVEN